MITNLKFVSLQHYLMSLAKKLEFLKIVFFLVLCLCLKLIALHIAYLMIFLYVDDFVMCFRLKYISIALRKLQLVSTKLTKLADSNGFKFTENKTCLFLPHDTMLAQYMLLSCICHNPVLYQNGITQTKPYDSIGAVVFWCQRFQ